jgi:hypothetical protein
MSSIQEFWFGEVALAEDRDVAGAVGASTQVHLQG